MRMKLLLLAAMTFTSGALFANMAVAATALPSCEAKACVTMGFCSISCNLCEERQCVYNPFDE